MSQDVFTAMIEEELNQYQHSYLYEEKELLKNRNYKELAKTSLRKMRFISTIMILVILGFSASSIFHFIEYGMAGGWVSFILGCLMWLLVLAATIFYTRDLLGKKRSMIRVLKLLEAREEYINEKKSRDQ